MLDNSTPRYVRGFLGLDPEAKTASNGNVYADISISVSHYAGKDENGVTQRKTEWVRARIFDNQYNKTASLVLNNPEYKKGAPVMALLNQSFREEHNFYYKDKSGQMQGFKNPVQLPDYTVEDIGLWAKEKRAEGGQAPAQTQAQPATAAPQQSGAAPAANDAF